jgi:hypothetical protein
MKTKRNVFAVLLCTLGLLTHDAATQDVFSSALKMAFGDVANLKQKAEAGDPSAQLALADLLHGQFRSADAIGWYRKAAEQGSREALYKMGRLFLFGGIGSGSQSVEADPSAGIRLIFCAATNNHTAAFHDMHRAYRDGLGVAPDSVQAYAWLQLYADTIGGLSSTTSRSELNALALKVDVATSQEGRRLAAVYKTGHWPVLKTLPPAAPKSPPNQSEPRGAGKVPLPAAAPPKPLVPLKLTGIAFGAASFAVINDKVIAEGDSVRLPIKPTPATLKCLKIEKGSVLVSIEGEDAPRTLYLP